MGVPDSGAFSWGLGGMRALGGGLGRCDELGIVPEEVGRTRGEDGVGERGVRRECRASCEEQ